MLKAVKPQHKVSQSDCDLPLMRFVFTLKMFDLEKTFFLQMNSDHVLFECKKHNNECNLNVTLNT